jgi:hypothetical protein
MSITSLTGPVVVFQDGGILSLSSANQNPDQGPSLFLQATGLLDPRSPYTYYPGMAEGPVSITSAGAAVAAAPALGWINASFQVADFAPGTASTVSLVAAATVSSTSLTLIATSAGNITTASTCVNPATGATVTGLWLIDSKPASISYGTSGAIGIWDPANPAIGRAVSITSSASVSAITFTVNGYDAYGYPITQALAGGGSATTVYTTKTFKWISSVTASATTSTTVSVGVSDIYGLPLYCGAVAYIVAYWNNSDCANSATVLGTFVAGSALTTAGAGDVRGTFNPSSIAVSNGTIKMQLWQSVAPANLPTVAGLFGVTPA